MTSYFDWAERRGTKPPAPSDVVQADLPPHDDATTTAIREALRDNVADTWRGEPGKPWATTRYAK